MSRPFRDITGQTFGPWKVLRRGARHKDNTYWYCRGACGHEKRFALSALTQTSYGPCWCMRPTPQEHAQEYAWRRRVSTEPPVAIALHGRWVTVASIPSDLHTVGEFIAYVQGTTGTANTVETFIQERGQKDGRG